MALTKTTIELPKEAVVEIDGVDKGTQPAGDYVVELSEGVHQLKITFASGYILQEALNVPKSIDDVVQETITQQGLKTPEEVNQAIADATAGLKTPEEVQQLITDALASSQGYIVFKTYNEESNTLTFSIDTAKTPTADGYILDGVVHNINGDIVFDAGDVSYIEVTSGGNLVDRLNLSGLVVTDKLIEPVIYELPVASLDNMAQIKVNTTDLWYLKTSKNGLADNARTQVDSLVVPIMVDFMLYDKIEFFDASTEGNSLFLLTAEEFFTRQVNLNPFIHNCNAPDTFITVKKGWSVTEWDYIYYTGSAFERYNITTPESTEISFWNNSKATRTSDGSNLDVPLGESYLVPRALPAIDLSTIDSKVGVILGEGYPLIKLVGQV